MTAVPPAAGNVKPFLFQVNQVDLMLLFVEQLGLQLQPLSPLSELSAQAPGSGGLPQQTDPATLQNIAEQAEVRLAAAILADPQRRLLLRYGGGVIPVAEIFACDNPSFNAQAVVAISSTRGNIYQVETFPSAGDFAAWVADLLDRVPLFAALPVEAQALESAGMQEYLHLIPDSLPLETFIYLLHGIDSYRRASYGSMLDYKVNAELSLTAAEFDGSLIQSLNSRDLRWLLPAFMALTPGLAAYTLKPELKHLQVLLDRGLLAAGQVEGSQTLLYAWPEAGRRLGVEFYRTWAGGAGLELAFAGMRDKQTAERAFITPTALANHYFSLAQVEGGASVSHNPLDKSGLVDKIVSLFNLPVPVTPPPPAVFATLEEPVPFQPDSATMIASAWCLVFVSGPSQLKPVVLGKRASLGRSNENDVVIFDPLVSRQHALIELSGGGYLVSDLGSANGTFINDVPLSAPTRLRVGDLIKFGGTVFRFQPLYDVS